MFGLCWPTLVTQENPKSVKCKKKNQSMKKSGCLSFPEKWTKNDCLIHLLIEVWNEGKKKERELKNPTEQ